MKSLTNFLVNFTKFSVFVMPIILFAIIFGFIKGAHDEAVDKIRGKK